MPDIIPQDDMPRKQCYTCKRWKPATFDYFQLDNRRSDKLRTQCKDCRKGEKARLKARVRDVVPEGMMRCATCKEVYPAANEFFIRDKRKASGLAAICKICYSQKQKAFYDRPGEREKQAMRVHRNYEENKEVRQQQRQRWKQEHRESYLEWNRQYMREHREIYADYRRWYYKEHPERLKASQQRFLQTHPTYYTDYRRRWNKEHREQRRASYHRQRAMRRRAEGRYTAQDIRDQHRRQRDTCYYCQKKLNGKYHIDHIVPLSRGGTNWPDNLVLTCPLCNQRKGNKFLHEWIQGGRLL